LIAEHLSTNGQSCDLMGFHQP